ncbi:MAG TPA: ABC transporter substrate-binding protein [Jatrophihabitans sp.]
MRWKKVTAAAAAGSAVLVGLAACSSSGGSGTPSSNSASGGGSSTTPSSSTTLTGDCAPYSAYAGPKGTVTMFGSILSPESDSLNKSWAKFQSCTGITIKYTGSNSFESDLPTKVAGNSAPDLAIIPQPGLLSQMVLTGKVVDPPAQTVANEANWNDAWKSYGSVAGKFYAAPMSANLKTLVWYSPSFFKANGYTVPTTWADMMTLSDKIAAAGKAKPWCGGIGSGTATGWPATDWLEEIVLGKEGGDVYDKWISHDIKFSDPQIQDAMTIMKNWMLNPTYVGDVKKIATTTFQDAGLPILTNKCAMLQQASFYEAQWPKGTTVGPDKDVMAFYLPAAGDTSKPVEGGGEFVTAFSNRPEVQAVQNYLSSPEWADSRIAVAPGWVSANEKVDQTLYTDPIDKLSAQFLADPSATFRFDASDAMPAAVGSGQEWKSMVDWFTGTKDQVQVAKDIDAAWPAS